MIPPATAQSTADPARRRSRRGDAAPGRAPDGGGCAVDLGGSAGDAVYRLPLQEFWIPPRLQSWRSAPGIRGDQRLADPRQLAVAVSRLARGPGAGWRHTAVPDALRGGLSQDRRRPGRCIHRAAEHDQPPYLTITVFATVGLGTSPSKAGNAVASCVGSAPVSTRRFLRDPGSMQAVRSLTGTTGSARERGCPTRENVRDPECVPVRR
jgi:hypothetical protein